MKECKNRIEEQIYRRRRRPNLRVHRDGRILLGTRVVRLLGLQPGDSLGIVRCDGEVLLHVTEAQSGDRRCGSCYVSNRRACTMVANSVELARLVLGLSVPDSAEAAGFYVGQVILNGGRQYLPIITRNPVM